MNNLIKDQNFILINGAGKILQDPILKGLSIKLTFEFRQQTTDISVFLNNTELTLAQDDLSFYCWITAGTSPSISGKNVIRIQTTSIQGKSTYLEQYFFVSSDVPTDLIEVYDIVQNDWVSLINSTPTVCQMMAIRFLESYYNEMEIGHFGGIGYVNVADRSGLLTTQVRAFTEKEISQVHYIYLQKHQIGTVENHKFTIGFQSKLSAASLNYNCEVNTPACIALEIQDPQYST